MPGAVVTVSIHPGDTVSAGQKLLAMEAMKMETTIYAERDGKVAEVFVTPGTQVDTTLEDKIVFHNDTELDLNDLRRRARALGGRFQLKASKSEYLVSNDPSRLQADFRPPATPASGTRRRPGGAGPARARRGSTSPCS